MDGTKVECDKTTLSAVVDMLGEQSARASSELLALGTAREVGSRGAALDALRRMRSAALNVYTLAGLELFHLENGGKAP